MVRPGIVWTWRVNRTGRTQNTEGRVNVAEDSYLKFRCGVCGGPWRDNNGNVIHPSHLACHKYLPEPTDEAVPDAIAVNMPGKYDPRNLRRMPGETFPGSPSFERPKRDAETQRVLDLQQAMALLHASRAEKAIDVQPSTNGKHE